MPDIRDLFPDEDERHRQEQPLTPDIEEIAATVPTYQGQRSPSGSPLTPELLLGAPLPGGRLMPVTSGRSRQAGQGLAAFTSLLTGLLTPPAEHGLPPPLRNELAPLAQGGLPLATANPQQTARQATMTELDANRRSKTCSPIALRTTAPPPPTCSRTRAPNISTA